MIIYDEVKVINDRPEYINAGIQKGMVGTIISAEIRDNNFLLCFVDKNMEKDDIIISVHIKDLELVKRGFATMDTVWDELPSKDPRWWCQVEDGFIKNFKGEKKNKIPYDYEE